MFHHQLGHSWMVPCCQHVDRCSKSDEKDQNQTLDLLCLEATTLPAEPLTIVYNNIALICNTLT